MRKTLAAFLAFILLSLPAFAAGPPLPSPESLRYPPLHFRVPRPETVVLDNGITVFFYEDRELPLVKVTALVRTGSVYDPEGKEGLADLTGQLLRDGGTKGMKSGEIDDTLEQLAIELESGIAAESGSVSLSVLTKDLDRGLDIFARIIREPAFEAAKFDLARNLKLEDIRRIADSPQRFAFREFNRVIYQNHPRGRMATFASVSGIGREDLVAFHRRFFRPANIMIAVSGDISKQEATERIARAFGDWKEEGPIPAPPPPVPRQGGGVYYLAKKTPQSVVIVAHRAPSFLTEDTYPFRIFDFIVGSGGFPSRIFQEVRTNEGLAYSAGSFYRPRATEGVFSAYAFTKSATTGKALSMIRAIVRDGAGRPISAQELTWAKKAVDSGFIFSFTSAHQIAYQQMQIAYDGLPKDHMETYLGKIDAVTLADLARVKEQYVLPEEEIVFVVGDDEALKQLKTEFKDIIVREGLL